MNPYENFLEEIIVAFEQGDAAWAMNRMDNLRLGLGGQKSIYDMMPAEAMVYVLALYVARSER